MVKISIITINLNNKYGLEKTIKSVINQDFKDYEWLILDGGSTDGSIEIIEKYSTYITFWKSEKDNGIFYAMNKGIDKSKGKYLLFLNSGDTLESDTCLSEISPFLIDKDFYVGFQISDEGRRGPKHSNKLYLDYYLILNSLPHQATFIHRDMFIKYGKYNENLTIVSDWWFTVVAILVNNASLFIIKKNICYYDLNGISLTKHDIRIKERLQMLDSIDLSFWQSFFHKYFKLKIFCYNKFPCFYMFLFKFLNKLSK